MLKFVLVVSEADHSLAVNVLLQGEGLGDRADEMVILDKDRVRSAAIKFRLTPGSVEVTLTKAARGYLLITN